MSLRMQKIVALALLVLAAGGLGASIMWALLSASAQSVPVQQPRYTFPLQSF